MGRFTATMPGEPQAEALVAWRFHHALTGIGTRNESTLYMGVSGTTQTLPRTDGPPLSREPAYYIAAATGHISRSYYVWAGGGYQLYGHWGGSEDHQSNSLLTSVVVGWRPRVLLQRLSQTRCTFFLGDDRRLGWNGASRRNLSHFAGYWWSLPALRPFGLPGAHERQRCAAKFRRRRNLFRPLIFVHLSGYRHTGWSYVPALESTERHPTRRGNPRIHRCELFFPERAQMTFSWRSTFRGIVLGGLLLAIEPVRAEYRRIQIKVYGLDCELCARGVSASIHRLAGVRSVE